MDREYKILVSYALARNSGAVFQDVEASSARARAKIEADSKASGDSVGKSAKKGADLLGKSFDDAAARGQKAYAQIVAAADRAAAQEAAAAARAAQARVAADQRAFDQKLRLAQRAAAERVRIAKKEEEDILREVERAEKKAASVRERERKKSTSDRESAIGSFASNAYGNMKGAASRALGVAGAIAGGMGVKLDIGSQIGAAGDFRRSIVDVTNAGMGIQGKLASKGDYASTTKSVEEAADYTKIDQNKVAEGLSVFVDKASDIEAGKAMLKNLGDIAQASGTDFVELAGSAGEFFKMMDGDGPSKIKNVGNLLALAAKQGQVGNLAFKELAPTIGKLASQGQKITGNYSENLGQLMALSQIALQGGAAKGAEATRSGQAFVMDLSKGATLKSFKKHDVKIFEDQNAEGGGTVLRQMEPLIMELLRKSKGDIKTLSEEFKGQKSAAVIQGAANIFRGAGGTEAGGLEKGLAAVQAAFDKYKQPMSEAEIKNSAGAVREGADAKAAAFNNQLERIAGSLADRVLPEMERLGPKLLELVEAFSKIIGWAAENPGKAITVAIVGSIAKAAMGAAVSAAIAALIKGAAGGGGIGGGVGALGSRLGAAAAGIAIGVEGGMYANDKMEEGAETATDRMQKSSDVIAMALAEFKKTGELSPETQKALKMSEQANKKEIEVGKGTATEFDALRPFSGVSLAQYGEQEGAKAATGTLTNQNDVIEQLLGAPAKKHSDAADKLSTAADKLTVAAGKFTAPTGGGGAGRPGVAGHGGGP